MARRFCVLILMVAITFPSLVLGQQDEPMPTSVKIDVASPFLEVSYGMASPAFKDAGFDYENIGMLEFKAGYGFIDSSAGSIVAILDSYLFFSLASSDLGSSGSAEDEGSKFNRFGMGNRLGFGYQGETRGLDLYNQNALHWTEFTAADGTVPGPEAEAVFDRLGSQHRFGHLMEAGAEVRLSPSMALNVGAEGAVIYPRYVFWPWLGSVAIYSALQGTVEYFADAVMESSPSMGPVIYFVLKTAVSAGYYFATQDDMNWPFDSERPVTVGSLKIGATFSF